MARVRTLTLAAGAAALIAFGGGCIHIHMPEDGKTKSTDPASPVQAKAPAKPDGPAKVDGAVKQASAVAPVGPRAAAPASKPSFPRLTGKADGPKAATEFAVTWQPRLSYLPDPTRNGASGAGLVGQMFLYGPGYQFVAANGTLKVEMADATPRAGGPAQPTPLGSWTFDKETLRRLVTGDETWGKCYALFLPWPDYRPDITQVTLTARYDPESGHPLFASPSTITIDTRASGEKPAWTSEVTRPPAGPSPLGGPPPANLPPAGMTPPGGSVAPPGPASGPAGAAVPFNPMPINPAAGPTPPAAPGAGPDGLPPIAFTIPARK